MKKILVSLFFVTCSLFGVTLDDCSRLIENEKIIGEDDKKAGTHFFNAGVIYGAQGDKKNEVIMYEKAIEYKVENAFYNLGISYYYGEGVAKNHIKAYEHFKEALKLGLPNAQNAIETVCKKSPWACK